MTSSFAVLISSSSVDMSHSVGISWSELGSNASQVTELSANYYPMHSMFVRAFAAAVLNGLQSTSSTGSNRVK